MSKKPTAKDKKFINDFLTDLQWLFAIQNYERGVSFVDEDRESDKEGFSTYADVLVEEDYQRIKIRIYNAFWGLSREQQCKTLLHELCHVVTWPLKEAGDCLLDGKLVTREAFRVAMERSTATIENMLHDFLRGYNKHARECYQKYLKG